MTETTRVLLVDDHTLMREVLGDRLAAEPDMQVVGSASNADDAVSLAVAQQPDIVLMDIDMPGLLCFDAAKMIHDRCPKTRILFLSAFFHDRYVEQALAVGACGYLTKSEPTDKVIGAIRVAASGRTYYSPQVQARILIDSDGVRLASSPCSRASALTRRELEILRYIARGLSQKEIAETMHVAVATVRTHSVNLMRKLDIHSRVELARFAIREGLAEA